MSSPDTPGSLSVMDITAKLTQLYRKLAVADDEKRKQLTMEIEKLEKNYPRENSPSLTSGVVIDKPEPSPPVKDPRESSKSEKGVAVLPANPGVAVQPDKPNTGEPNTGQPNKGGKKSRKMRKSNKRKRSRKQRKSRKSRKHRKMRKSKKR